MPSDVLTSLDFLRKDQAWPPAAAQQRMKDYAQNKLLWEGNHSAAFGQWYRVLRREERASLEFTFNLFKRLSTFYADLLVGEPPAFQAGMDDSDEQHRLDEIVSRNDMAVRAYEGAIDISRYGDSVLKVYRDKAGKALIDVIPPSIWFPVVSRDNLRREEAHVLAWTFEDRREKFLRAEVHERGKVTNKVFRLEAGGALIGRELNIAEFFPGRKPVEATRADSFLIIPIHGLRTSDRYHGLDDYGDVSTIVMEMEVRVAQISRILDKHADPNMYGGEGGLDFDHETQTWRVKVGGKFYVVQPGEEPPGYVTWDGNLDAAFKELDELRRQFYLTSETSPAAFGQMDGTLAQSGTALRRMMQAPLAKVNRVRLTMDPALRRALALAGELEGTTLDVTVAWRDGLPADPAEDAVIETTLCEHGLRSTYLAVKHLNPDMKESDLQEELTRIKEDGAERAATDPGRPPPLDIRFGATEDAGTE